MKIKLNRTVFQKVEENQAHILVVTKYFDKAQIREILQLLKQEKNILGLGENRTESLKIKNIPRKKTHFIGRIQSRKIPDIVRYCSAIHSLDNLKHAKILDQELQKNPENKFDIFIQINISEESQKGGILPQQFGPFLKSLAAFKNLKIRGISGLGKGVFDEASKRREFQKLKKLRDEFLPGAQISAGTSRDYALALDEGIEIVRVGQACFLEH